jgi:hypothetical protein
MRRYVLLALLLLPITAAAAASATVEHVVILVIDGPRWSETWGEPTRQYIPQRAKLAAEGAWFSDFACDGPTYTNAGHAALTTGFHQDIENSGQALPQRASIFQRWLKASGAPAEQAWIVTSKDKLKVLADCEDPAWRGTFRPRTDCGIQGAGPFGGYRSDAVTFPRLLAVLKEHRPRITLANLKEPDARGHAKDWKGYLQAIRDTDAMAGELWQFMRTDPAFAGKSVLFITNDHGRHLDGVRDGFVNHGDDCPGCRKIELLALGAGIAPGTVVNRHHNQIDVAATTARLLGIDLPSAGKPIPELLGAAP